jgi:hypothetical protein
LLTACQPQPQLLPQNPAVPGRCGDGICEGPEILQNCPEDCPSIAATELIPDQSNERQVEVTGSNSNRPLLYLGIMVHLEGWDDNRDQESFERHVSLVREYADLFERYGAKLTLESKELTDGSIRWGDNVLLEMERRGHGIGVHADIGGSLSYDCDRFTPDLRAERLQLESLGVSVRHVSGNTSHCDWVTATINAGYEFTTGTVAYNVMSMPEESRPEEYRHCPTPSKCHQIYPPDLVDRLHPWRAMDGSNWLTHDPEGGLVILASDGGLNCIQEELEGGVTSPCEFNDGDIAYTVDRIEEALSLASPDQVNLIYFSWSLGKPLDPEIMEVWLEKIKPFVDEGTVSWAALPEIYDAYLVWEQSN